MSGGEKAVLEQKVWHVQDLTAKKGKKGSRGIKQDFGLDTGEMQRKLGGSPSLVLNGSV